MTERIHFTSACRSASDTAAFGGIGAQIEKGEVGFAELEAWTLKNGEPMIGSGRQEMLENLINEFV